jgi:hypothetical protein
VFQRLFGQVESQGAGQWFQVWRESLLARRPALLRYGVASEGEIDTVLGRLAEAAGLEFEVLFPILWVELVAQVPVDT